MSQSPRHLFHLLDTGRLSPEAFREAMREHAREIIVEMEEDHANPMTAFLEQMRCRRAAARLLKQHEEAAVREVLLALAELEDFTPARWLWNAGHPHIPLHAFFRIQRDPVFRIVHLEALPQVVSVQVEHGRPGLPAVTREEIRLRRDRRGSLGLERRRVLETV